MITMLVLMNVLFIVVYWLNHDFYAIRYYRLIYRVGNKYSGETRYQTALRYIVNAEKTQGPNSSKSLKEKQNEKD